VDVQLGKTSASERLGTVYDFVHQRCEVRDFQQAFEAFGVRVRAQHPRTNPKIPFQAGLVSAGVAKRAAEAPSLFPARAQARGETTLSSSMARGGLGATGRATARDAGGSFHAHAGCTTRATESVDACRLV
jgi:hypothetical protein